MTETVKTAHLMEIPVRTPVADWVESAMWVLSEPHIEEGVAVEFVASLKSGRLQDLAAATRDGQLILTSNNETLMLVTDGIGSDGSPESHSIDQQLARIGYIACR